MSRLPRVRLIIASADTSRLYAALETAMALQALGRSVSLFFQGEAVILLRTPITHTGDPARIAAGQPDLAWLVREATEMDVRLVVCQSGLALANLTQRDLDPIVQPLGLIGYLADVEPADLMLVY